MKGPILAAKKLASPLISPALIKKITLSQSDCPSLNWSNKIQYKWKANSGLGEAGEGQAVPGTITQNAARDFVT